MTEPARRGRGGVVFADPLDEGFPGPVVREPPHLAAG